MSRSFCIQSRTQPQCLQDSMPPLAGRSGKPRCHALGKRSHSFSHVAAPWLSALGPSGWILLGPLALCMQPPKSSSFPSSNPHSASISPFLTLFAATPHPLKTFHCALGSRGHSSRIFCILILFLKCSLHLLALQQNSHLRILLSLQSSQKIIACSPTALVSIGLEGSSMFSLFLMLIPMPPLP